MTGKPLDPSMISLDTTQYHAIVALSKGSADPEQQGIALDWIIYNASAMGVSGFHQGGEEGRRASDFSLGRKFTGEQITAVIRMPFDKLFPETKKG